MVAEHGRILAQSYTDDPLEDTYNWMLRWGLLNTAACPVDIVDNRLAQLAVADDRDDLPRKYQAKRCATLRLDYRLPIV